MLYTRANWQMVHVTGQSPPIAWLHKLVFMDDPSVEVPPNHTGLTHTRIPLLLSPNSI